MSNWKTETLMQLKGLKDPILIVGLPGIGNVGKICTDYLSEELKAKRAYSFFSHSMPHSVFVNEKNLVELPSIDLKYVKRKKNDLFLLTGDIQPMNEQSCYDFCDTLLDLFQQDSGKEVISIGGIGLREIPQSPKVYGTGSSREMIERYRKAAEFNTHVYGVVGPIMGVSGVIVGLAGRRKLPAMSLLAETLGHPMYLGLASAREILKVLDKSLSLGLSFKRMDKEIKDMDEHIKKGEDIEKISKDKLKFPGKLKRDRETNYIG